jgi:hypothetical protein
MRLSFALALVAAVGAAHAGPHDQRKKPSPPPPPPPVLEPATDLDDDALLGKPNIKRDEDAEMDAFWKSIEELHVRVQFLLARATAMHGSPASTPRPESSPHPIDPPPASE